MGRSEVCKRCGARGHVAQDHAWDPELRAADKAGLAPGDVDAVVDVLLAADAVVVDEPYDRDGTPGRACTHCGTAWPATEPDGASWHHKVGCPAMRTADTMPAPPPCEATSDPTINATTGKPCRGKRAALALAKIMAHPQLPGLLLLVDAELYAEAVVAAAPFHASNKEKGSS